jgi:hypothetical protein
VSDRPLTPKQALLGHVEERHHQALPASWTKARIAKWHANTHWRYSPDHYHAGSNRGPDDRPDGWETGADAIPNPPGLYR